MTASPKRGAPSERTMLVTAPDFNRDGKVWRPFTFTGLEKVSRAQVTLSDRVRWLMPGVTPNGRVPEDLLERLRELFDEDVQLLMDYQHVIRPRELPRYVSDPALLAVLAPAPHKTRGFLEIELSLAHAAIDRLLGGTGEAMTLRALTDIEEGVISFVILEVLKALAPRIEPGLPRIRLEGMALDVAEAASALADERYVAVVQFKGVLGKQAGYLRFFLPESVLALCNPLPSGPERRARAAAHAVPFLGRIKGAKTWLRAEIGALELTTDDFRALSSRDVVVLDRLNFRPDLGETGVTHLKVGRGQLGHMQAQVTLEDGRYRATIESFIFEETAQESEAPVPEGSDVQEKNEGAELLGDIPLHITVELSRVQVSAEEVVSLRVGQVMDLNRMPNEPVELSVNSKVVARGELVEVEGHMGVRILTLAG